MEGSPLFFGEPAAEEPETLPSQTPSPELVCPPTLPYPPGDIDYSGNVDINDLVIILANLAHAQDPEKSQVLSDVRLVNVTIVYKVPSLIRKLDVLSSFPNRLASRS